MILSRSEFVDINGIRVHVRRWGPADAPMLFMVHGWMDVAASFQFVADVLAERWQIIAPDLRGFGLSDWPVAARGGGSYWFYDYLADLDGLLDHYAPQRAVNLVGHSLGGGVVCAYAGVRPERVRRVVNLEGFGLRGGTAADAPANVRAWLDELREPPALRPGLRPYATLDAVAARLIKNNPRLPASRARFLAEHWSKPDGDGGYRLLADPAHKLRNPLVYRLEEIVAIWSRVTAPVLHVEAAQSATLARLAGPVPIDEFRARFRAFADWREAIIENAGHMLQHDQPEQVAALIDGFCR